MSQAEQHAYDEHLSAIMIQNDVLDGAKLEGFIEGKKDMARSLKKLGVPIETIIQSSGLSKEEIEAL